MMIFWNANSFKAQVHSSMCKKGGRFSSRLSHQIERFICMRPQKMNVSCGCSVCNGLLTNRKESRNYRQILNKKRKKGKLIKTYGKK